MSEVSKIALVTGANKGIGFEIPRQLGAQGITILVGARDQARGEAAVQQLRAEAIDATAVHLDVTNVFGVFAVTKAMLPLLRRAVAGRIVNLSSEVSSLSLNSDPTSFAAALPPTLAYNASKTALNALTVFFAKELRNTPIKVNAVSPGYVATDLNGHSGFLMPEQGAKVPVAFATLPVDGPTGGFFGENGIAW